MTLKMKLHVFGTRQQRRQFLIYAGFGLSRGRTNSEASLCCLYDAPGTLCWPQTYKQEQQLTGNLISLSCLPLPSLLCSFKPNQTYVCLAKRDARNVFVRKQSLFQGRCWIWEIVLLFWNMILRVLLGRRIKRLVCPLRRCHQKVLGGIVSETLPHYCLPILIIMCLTSWLDRITAKVSVLLSD